MADEWVIVAERDSGLTIARSGYATGGEAAAARRELERHLADDDTTNFLLLTREQADRMIAEDKAIQAPTVQQVPVDWTRQDIDRRRTVRK